LVKDTTAHDGLMSREKFYSALHWPCYALLAMLCMQSHVF
jgi:hypothetical protein